MSLRKRTGALVVSGLTALAVAGCGSQPSSDAPKPPSVLELLTGDLKGSLQKAIDATEKSDSVTVDMRGTMAGEKMSMQGVVDLGDPPKAEFTATGQDGTSTTIRMIDTVFYIELGAEERASMGGKRWMKMDLAAAGEQAGIDVTKQFEDVDPTKQVRMLLAAGNATVIGEETVNGARTVHYTVTAPAATYLGQLDAEARSEVEKQMTKQGVTEVKIDLWVDEQYRPRRAGIVMGKMGEVTVDYSDYGKPVNIETPPPAETADFAQMLQDLNDLSTGN